MKGDIQVVSDLHLEERVQRFDFVSNPLLPIAPVLIVAGDTANLLSPNVFRDQKEIKPILDYLSKNWETVYMIPGNHEYYGTYINEFPVQWFGPMEGYKNIFMGNQYHVETGNTVLIFATLWSLIPESHLYYYQAHMDFKCIFYQDSRLSLELYNDTHKKDVEYIKKTCEEYKDQDKIIVTHHLPDRELIARHHKGSKINDAFASDAFYELQKYDIKTWIFGHSHNAVDRKMNGCRFLANAWGYSYVKFEKKDEKAVLVDE